MILLGFVFAVIVSVFWTEQGRWLHRACAWRRDPTVGPVQLPCGVKTSWHPGCQYWDDSVVPLLFWDFPPELI